MLQIGFGFTVTDADPETVPGLLASFIETNAYVVLLVGETVKVYGVTLIFDIVVEASPFV
jgi:hypothetical protein